MKTTRNHPRIMIGAVKSGSGKTTLTCALLKQLKTRGKKLRSLKCGPDYIDGMFHEQVLGIPSKNLDTFFSSPEQTRALFALEQTGEELSVAEGVMGLYDGLGGIREEGSSYHLAEVLEMPIILVVDAKGMGRSIIPLLAGFQQYDKKKLIRGVILNRTTKMYFQTIAPLIEKELGIKALGCFPQQENLTLQSRHLGLVLPEEITALEEQLTQAGQVLEQNVDIDEILRIAESAAPLPLVEEPEEAAYGKRTEKELFSRIAVAKDEAFCFYYRDNLKMLEYYGAELVFFSPLRDKALPEGVQGILLGGGYPELYAQQLSENAAMRQEIKKAIQGGMPVLAECGGFLYLQTGLTDPQGKRFAMAGVLSGEGEKKKKLVRFGYIEVTAQQPSFFPMGEKIKGHEFHYYDTTDNGESCLAVKPVTGRSWECIHSSQSSFLGFPHLYYPSNPAFVKAFVKQTAQYGTR